MSALLDATRGLAQTAPDLLDALHQAVEPMQTFAETRGQLASLLSGADYTVGTTRQSFDNHIDQLIRITADFTPVLGVLAQKSNNFVPAVANWTTWPTSSWSRSGTRRPTWATCARC